MKERFSSPQMGEKEVKSEASGKQQAAFEDNLPSADELTRRPGGALTSEQSKASALAEDREISREERARSKAVGEMTLENLKVPLNRRRPQSFYERPGRRS